MFQEATVRVYTVPSPKSESMDDFSHLKGKFSLQETQEGFGTSELMISEVPPTLHVLLRHAAV